MLPLPIPDITGEDAKEFIEAISKPSSDEHLKILKEATIAYETIQNISNYKVG